MITGTFYVYDDEKLAKEQVNPTIFTRLEKAKKSGEEKKEEKPVEEKAQEKKVEEKAQEKKVEEKAQEKKVEEKAEEKKVEDKVIKYWIEKNLPKSNISLDTNIVKLSAESLAKIKLDPKLLRYIEGREERSKTIRKKKLY